MIQIGQIAAYVLWVGSSFAFITLVPIQDAPSFLSIYAAGSFIVGLFAVPIYTSWRSRIFDLSFVGACALAIAVTFQNFVFPAYLMAAVALNIVDFSVAQTGKPNAVMLSRVSVSLCALLLMVDFALALYLRLFLCAVLIWWSTFIKKYEGHNIVKIQSSKVVFTALNCSLYYIPLIIIPQFSGQHSKFVYLSYAIAGSIVLKIQDFIIKIKISKSDTINKNITYLYYISCIAATVLFFISVYIIEPFLSIFSISIVALVSTMRIVENVKWN